MLVDGLCASTVSGHLKFSGISKLQSSILPFLRYISSDACAVGSAHVTLGSDVDLVIAGVLLGGQMVRI
jgi:hypothetical protein